MLSNPGIDVDALLVHWVPYLMGDRSSVAVATDWTDFAADGQATIMLSLSCCHGRATPLMGLAVDTATLKDRATITSIRSWCAWPRCCPPMCACASWPTAALAAKNCIGC